MGTATITATTATGGIATCKITVTSDPTIADLSKWQGDIDWTKTGKVLDLAILRVQYGDDPNYIDSKYREYAAGCEEYGVPYGAYAYATYTTVAEARSQARLMVERTAGTNPLFYVIDIEEMEDGVDMRTCTAAFISTLRALGVEKVGLYIAHNLYTDLNLRTSAADFVWIPRYGTGTSIAQKALVPSYACDLWQYTSGGGLVGVNGDVDLNWLNGDKNLSWFIA